MKVKARVFMILSIGALTCVGAWMLVPSETDVRGYQDLVSRSQSTRTTKKNPYVATQHREGVVKDIYYGGADTMQARVKSESSRLVFDQQTGGMDILEYMEQLDCIMQKELFYLMPSGREIFSDGEGAFKDRKGKPVDITTTKLQPMQVVRHVVADQAIYYYNKEKLVADHPTITEYRLEGHEFPEQFDNANVAMSGVADNAEVAFDHGELTFHAKRMKARIFPKGRRS